MLASGEHKMEGGVLLFITNLVLTSFSIYVNIIK